ncbi:YrhB domain-containing protein [Streptomyces sp. enrichment culture]|uniref:YrhB domain-containing protein n=1 Tax=Streptomyces sp. enrichment culture TaxID=1795815 RepID=UPI003F554290
MIDRETAIRVVEEELERAYQRRAALGGQAMREVVTDVEEHELVWIVRSQSEEYVRTRDVRHAWVGAGPYLVDRVDGALHSLGVVSWLTGEWEIDYRVRIRGLAVRTAVDDLHDEIRDVAASQGPMPALRLLRRRLPVLSPGEALAYVRGLLDGDAPARLVAVAADHLVDPVGPVVTTILPGSARN